MVMFTCLWQTLSNLLIQSIGGVLDCALGRFRKVYFASHARVRLPFKLAAGLGEAWTRDGGTKGCPS